MYRKPYDTSARDSIQSVCCKEQTLSTVFVLSGNYQLMYGSNGCSAPEGSIGGGDVDERGIWEAEALQRWHLREGFSPDEDAVLYTEARRMRYV